MSKESENLLNLTMASDNKYVTYMHTAIKSIRKYNSDIPIDVYSCDLINHLFGEKNVRLHEVPVPDNLAHVLSTQEKEHAFSRVAKLEALGHKSSEKLMYIDSDIIVLGDIKEIETELKVTDSDKPVVYMLLRRPNTLSIAEIGWLYFKDINKLSSQKMANLVNDTFSVEYSASQLQNIRCWNGGIIYGSAEAVNTLSILWKNYYFEMLTGKNRNQFIPNDQLCLWLAVDQLEDKLKVRELPLKWNFMPGHALEQITNKVNCKSDDIKEYLKGVRILHFAQNKNDKWAQILVDEVNVGVLK